MASVTFFISSNCSRMRLLKMIASPCNWSRQCCIQKIPSDLCVCVVSHCVYDKISIILLSFLVIIIGYYTFTENRLTFELSLKPLKNSCLGWSFVPLLTFIMFKECSSRVRTPKYGEMHGKRLTSIKRWPCQNEFDDKLLKAPKTVLSKA